MIRSKKRQIDRRALPEPLGVDPLAAMLFRAEGAKQEEGFAEPRSSGSRPPALAGGNQERSARMRAIVASITTLLGRVPGR